jgi:transposase
MLIAIWHMGRDGTLYEDPGGDYFAITTLHPERTKNRACTSSRTWATRSP